MAEHSDIAVSSKIAEFPSIETPNASVKTADSPESISPKTARAETKDLPSSPSNILSSSFSSNPKKKRQWTLTPRKFLNPAEVSKVRRIALDRAGLHKAQNKRQGLRDWLILDLALSAGLRVQEIQGLCIGDLYLGYNQNHLVVRNGKGGKSRTVILDKKLVLHLKDYLKSKREWQEALEPESALLLSERGKAYTRRGLQKRFKALCKVSGLPEHFSIHSCRHTFCTELYRKTKNLRLVQKQAGHSSPAITQIYADVLDEDIKAGMDELYK